MLDSVHRRCVEEYKDASGRTEQTASEPFFKLAHGLPGSGKSEVLKLLTTYFMEVWEWQQGIHFVKIAFMNSMASNIDGSTIHSWGEVGFMDKTGQYCKPTRQAGKDVPTMNTKCASLRWILVDEIEAAGCELLTDLNDNVQQHTPDTSPYKRLRYKIDGWHSIRAFGGQNTIFIWVFCK